MSILISATKVCQIKQWIYLMVYTGLIIYIMIQFKEKVSRDFKLVRQAVDEEDTSALSHTASMYVSTVSATTPGTSLALSLTTTAELFNTTYRNIDTILSSGGERTVAVREKCKALNVSESYRDWRSMNGRLVLNKSLYYCDIPKCGTAFMNLFLSDLFQCNGLCQETVITSETLQNNREAFLKHMTNAYSFMLVREPYARLFSAYENKLFLPNTHWKIIGIDIIKTVRPNASFVSWTMGHDVTFLELVKYVINNYENGITLNSHLQPMHMFCNSCNFQFSFIGKLETMSNDLIDLVDDWKVRGIVPKNVSSVAEIEANMLHKRSLGPYKHMFVILKQYGHMLSRYNLFLRTWSSYQIRGLILKKYSMPFAESDVASVNYIMFGDEIKKAVDESEKYVEELKAQREEALVQAYRTIPMELLTKLKEFMRVDCLLFGYETEPKIVFDRTDSNQTSEFNYFQGL